MYMRIRQSMRKHGVTQLTLAFHGTASPNIPLIFKTGWDASRRSGQAYGAGRVRVLLFLSVFHSLIYPHLPLKGEYFAEDPALSLGYCKGGKHLILAELALDPNATNHTMHGAVGKRIIVMKDPQDDLPRGSINIA